MTQKDKTISSWPIAVSCIIFFLITYLLLNNYSFLHWNVISWNYGNLTPKLKTSLFQLLGKSNIFRLTGLLPVIFMLWSFKGEPRKAAWVCVPFGTVSGLMALVIM